MKVYINDYEINRTPVIAYIDNVVVKRETFPNGNVWEEEGVNVPQLKKIIKGLEMMGMKVNKITIDCHFTDLDTKYYHRFPEDVTDKLWRYINWRTHRDLEVTIKRNRLCTVVDGYTITLPKRMVTNLDKNTLCVMIYTNQEEN